MAICSGLALPVQSAETIHFKGLDTPRLQKLFQNKEHIDIATIDLNEDGLNEFITKPKGCDGLCDFKILADVDGTLLSLGTLAAHNLLLGNAYSHGVRDLLVFNDPANDYNYTVYVWESEHSQYMMRE